MKIPFIYIIRSLFQRKTSTLMTIISFTLVVLALISLLAMVEGVNKTLISSGAPDRLFIINKNATNENQSRLSQQDIQILGTFDAIKLDDNAEPVMSNETVATVMAQNMSGIRLQSNFRGVNLNKARSVHYQLKLIDGHFFQMESNNEIIIGKEVRNALNVKVGSPLFAKQSEWIVTGIFEDNGSPFESEIWTSRTNMALTFDRPQVTSVWALVKNPRMMSTFVNKLNHERSLNVFATSEQDYFKQGTIAAQGFQILTWFIAIIMSIGAIFSAMNTMYASIADRAPELAILRAIGFRARSVRLATLIESLILAISGGLLASVLALFFQGITFRTPLTGLGYVTFEITLTPLLIFTGILFSVFMGLLGGWLPSRRAIKISIIEGLNS
ncbi:MAG TPA: FtsX-like permease family protein [Balneolales bacterium]|nr:FtsX-like permease family protein [Balneolales bacterium]